MAQPVWVLSVDLQTKTATFQSGMAEAAKSARGAFTEIKGGGDEMAKGVGYSMFEARHGVMLLGEEFGVHLPRALSTFIASVGPIGAAMEAAFPFLAIAVGATLLIEHLVQLHEAGEKLTQDQVKFGTAVQTAFNELDQKILQAQIHSDNLKNDHLGALRHELELIDQQSMGELVHAFTEVAKTADVVFGGIKSHWYSMGIGATGAKHAMDEFQTQYESLLAHGKDPEASDLLSGTLSSAQKTADMMRQFKDSQADNTHLGNYQKFEEAAEYLKQRGLLSKISGNFTKDELTAQDTLVESLKAQVELEGKLAGLKALEKGNAKTETGKEMGTQAAAQAKEAAQAAAALSESELASQRSGMNALLEAQRAGIGAREAVELSFAARSQEIKRSELQAEIAALNKGSNDYLTQLKGLQEKELELDAQYAAQVAEIKSRASVQTNQKALVDLETSEREQIAATRQSSAERLAAINDALRTEQSLGLQDTAFYRDLLQQKVQATRQMLEEDGKLREEGGKESAENEQRTGELMVAAMRQSVELYNSGHRTSDGQRVAQATAISNQEYQVKAQALQREVEALDKSGADYQNKLKALQDKEKQLVQQHEQDLTSIKEKAEMERNQRILSADTRQNEAIAQGLTNVIMRHQTFAQMMTSLSNQVVSGMLNNAIQSILADDMTKERDAAAAARKGFLAGMSLPFPANIIAAPVLAAGAFTAVMAYQGGTDSVPGFGKGDKTPAMLEPGEGVVPGGVMDGLRDMARDGGFSRKPAIHIHGVRFAPTIHALDADGVDAVLTKHQATFQKHMEHALRKANH